VAGVEPQTETVWRQADRYRVPRMIFANKMDRTGANFDRCLAMIRDRLSKRAFPLQLPVARASCFTGHIDVSSASSTSSTRPRSARRSPSSTSGRPARRDGVGAPRGDRGRVEHDDELMEKYLGGAELSMDEIRRAIRKATIAWSSCRCCAAPRSRTRACRRCSTR
jgi:elongation factor G